MQQQTKEQLLAEWEPTEKWYKCNVIAGKGEKPETTTRSEQDVKRIRENLNNFGLKEVNLRVNECDSLFASMAFWEKRLASNLGPQFISSDDEETDFRPNNVSELRTIFESAEEQFGGAIQLMKWVLQRKIRAFVVFPDSIQHVPERTEEKSMSKPVAIFSCCGLAFFRPVVFRCAAPTISFDELATNMFPFLGRVLEASWASQSTSSRGVELSVGTELIKLIPSVKDPNGFRFMDDERHIMFFGPQGVGKSHLINCILRTSMEPITDEVYKLLTTWKWLSFQETWTAEEITPLTLDAMITELAELKNEHDQEETSIEWAEQSSLRDTEVPDGYVMPEGNEYSTTSVNAEVKYSAQFAINFTFHSQEFVAAALASYKRKIQRTKEEAADEEEVEDTAQFHRGSVMVGPSEGSLTIDPFFKNKLGCRVRYSSPSASVEESIAFLKKKMAFYTSSAQNVWGLLSSILIEMPVPLLFSGGRLIDSPGLVVDDAVRREQTMAALKKASALIYVSGTGDLGGDQSLPALRDCAFWQDYLNEVIRACLVAKKTDAAGAFKPLPKILFVFNSDKTAKFQDLAKTKKRVEEHLKKAPEKFNGFFKQKILQTTAAIYREESANAALPFSERELIDFVKAQLWQCHTTIKDYPPWEQEKKAAKSRTLKKIFAAAHKFPFYSEEVARGPVALMHVQFNYFEEEDLTAEEAGVALLLNSIRAILKPVLSVPRKVDELLRPLYSEVNVRLKMGKIESKEHLDVLRSVMGDIEKKVSQAMKNLNSRSSNWTTTKKGAVKREIDKLLVVEAESSYKYLKTQIKVKLESKNYEYPDFLNRICRANGEFSAVSMSSLMMEPVWRQLDTTLANITNILLPKNSPPRQQFEFDDNSLLNQILQTVEEFPLFKHINDDVVNIFIDAEKERFIQLITTTVTQSFDYRRNFALEIESLKIYCQEKLEKVLVNEESKLPKNSREKNNLRKIFLKKILPDYVQDCVREIKKRLQSRVFYLLDYFVSDARQPKLNAIVQQAMRDMIHRYSVTTDKSELDALSAFSNYIKACHLSFLDCMIDSTIDSSQSDLYSHVLNQLVQYKMASSTKEFTDGFNALEWRKILEEPVRFVDNRWSFLEKRVVVEYAADINKDAILDSTPVVVPRTHLNHIVEKMQKYPFANCGEERKKYAFKNITAQLRKKFLSVKEALDYFNCYLNVHEDVQKIFFPQTVNLRSLHLRKFILDALKSPIVFSGFEDLSEIDKGNICAEINYHLKDLSYEKDNSLPVILSMQQLEEAVSILQLDFEKFEDAVRVIQQMVDRREKKSRKKGTKKEQPSDNSVSERSKVVSPRPAPRRSQAKNNNNTPDKSAKQAKAAKKKSKNGSDNKKANTKKTEEKKKTQPKKKDTPKRRIVPESSSESLDELDSLISDEIMDVSEDDNGNNTNAPKRKRGAKDKNPRPKKKAKRSDF